MRVLVTGSRNWTDRMMIVDALIDVLKLVPEEESEKEKMTLVTGACPTGADAIAEDIARMFGWAIERHPADWSLGRRAGPLRNQAMVDLGADVCLAFQLEGSRGTRDCIDRAEHAGIDVYIYEPGVHR